MQCTTGLVYKSFDAKFNLLFLVLCDKFQPYYILEMYEIKSQFCYLQERQES